VGPRVGLDGCGKSRLQRDSIPRTVQPVASRYTDYAVPADRIFLCEYPKSYPITGLDRLLAFQEFEAPKISRQSAHEVGKVVSPTHRPPLSSEDIPGTHFC